MKTIIFFATFLILFSCSSKDQQFCDCMKAGEELNDFSSTLFKKVITPELHKKMMDLKEKKNTACKNYQTMSGAKMMELKAECE